MRTGLLAVMVTLLVTSGSAAQSQPSLQLQGQPYFGGSMKLHLTGMAGQPALVAYGLNPLPEPLQTAKGPWSIGTLVNLVALGSIPPSGRIDLPFTMPPELPALTGIPVVMQGYVPTALSNSAVLTLDSPYLVPPDATVFPSPSPSIGAQFGYIVAVGDFNADGVADLAASAAYQASQGISQAGKTYVLWGPTFAVTATLAPPDPRENGFFGISLTVADVNGDAIDDLVVGETGGSPSVAGVTPNLHVFLGDSVFPGTGSFVIEGPESGSQYSGYTHTVAAGDFNDDGFIDLAVGNNKATVQGLLKAGQIDVYWGPQFVAPTGIVSSQPGATDAFGSWLASADTNGDGIEDLIEASSADDVGGIESLGSMHVLVGPSLAIVQTLNCPAPAGPATGFGASLAAADVDGDGFADAVIGDFKDRAFVIRAPEFETVSIVAKPPSYAPNPLGESSYAWSLGAADVNRDGFADVLIGDWFEGDLTGCSVGGSGTVFAALGPYFSTYYRIHDVHAECGAEFGRSFTSADLDGDGLSELVVGSIYADDGGLSTSGHVTVLPN